MKGHIFSCLTKDKGRVIEKSRLSLRREAKHRHAWAGLTEQGKRYSAVMTDYPENAEVMYYKALGFQDMGFLHYGSAIATFKDAMKMKGSEKWIPRCRSHIGHLENKMRERTRENTG